MKDLSTRSLEKAEFVKCFEHTKQCENGGKATSVRKDISLLITQQRSERDMPPEARGKRYR